LNKSFNDNWAKFIRQCFAFKRKTLVNNLKSIYTVDDIQQQLHKLGLDLTIRSEQLSSDLLFQLYQGLSG
jgi:16S rRNA (adenine1518-N6/adenine1519-N6)-dimethyltransferase